MNRKHLGILYPVIIIGGGVALALISAASGPGLRLNSDPGAAALYQAPAATSVAAGVSRPGSTDGIVWMGFIIVLIVLIPILLRKSTWTK